MPTQKAEAEWKGNLQQGGGRIKLGSGAFEGPYSFKSRFEEGQHATNPEELIGGAHAGCFTMALTLLLTQSGITATRLHTSATVKLEKEGAGFAITSIALVLDGEVPGIDAATFEKYALDAKQNCPVSKALAGTKISLTTTLR
jgi:osmotically inducible protein OsmC